MSFPYTPELDMFQAADDAWMVELVRTFGNKAGQARYEERGKGLEGTPLRQLHDEREFMRVAWYRSAHT